MLAPAEVIAELEGRGYALAIEDGRLKVRGPERPSAELERAIAEHRDGFAARVLLKNPPDWLRLMLDRCSANHVYVSRRKGPDGQPVRYRVTLETICANVAGAIGLSPLDGERIRSDVEGAVRSWEPPETMEMLVYD